MKTPLITTNLRSPKIGSPDAILMQAVGVLGPDGTYNEADISLGDELLTYAVESIDFDECTDLIDAYRELGICECEDEVFYLKYPLSLSHALVHLYHSKAA